MRRWMVLLGLLLVAVAVLGRLGLKALRGEPVGVAEVTRGRVVSAVYATGRVDSDRRATVRARLAAPLVELTVGPGQEVRAGHVVARQDATAFRLARERAELEAEGARAALAELEDGEKRAERLAEDALLAEESLVRARQRAREQRAAVAARLAALELALEQESWAVLRAPLDGVVSSLARRAGDALREGDDILTIVDLSDAYVRVAVDERDVGRVVTGQRVRMVFDAYPGKVFDGTVWRVVPAVDRLTKSTDVLVRLPESRPPLQLDLTVTVNIVTGTIADGLTVPRDALDGSGESRAVFLIGEGRRAVRREVKIGVCDESRCQVLEGVAAGERVVAPLPPGIGPGDRVHVEERERPVRPSDSASLVIPHRGPGRPAVPDGVGRAVQGLG